MMLQLLNKDGVYFVQPFQRCSYYLRVVATRAESDCGNTVLVGCSLVPRPPPFFVLRFAFSKVVVPIMGRLSISLPYSLQFLIKKPKLYMLNYHY